VTKNEGRNLQQTISATTSLMQAHEVSIQHDGATIRPHNASSVSSMETLQISRPIKQPSQAQTAAATVSRRRYRPHLLHE